MKSKIKIYNRCKQTLQLDSCLTKDVLKAIFKNYLIKVRYYLQKCKIEKDVENLHQLRVNIRKTRTILKEFKEYFEPNFYQYSYKFLKDFMKETNLKRDLDVFMQDISFYEKKFKIDLSILKRELKRFQNQEEKNLKKLIQKNEKKIIDLYKRFILDSFYIENNKNIIDTAIIKVKNRAKKIEKNLKNFSSKDLHKIRIEFKKLRYLLENFSFLYNKKKVLKNIKKIQDILGKYHDIEVQKNSIEKFIKDPNIIKKISKYLNRQKRKYEKEFIKNIKPIKKRIKKLN